jgi:CheY-like chemotaxis protein
MAHLLVVDDDEIARMILGGMLESAGHQVTYASDGQVAVDLYRQGTFAAVVLDMVMPVKSGLQTIRELVKLDPDTRIVTVSGASDGDLALAKDVGALGVLHKPIERVELLEAVRSALERPPRREREEPTSQ